MNILQVCAYAAPYEGNFIKSLFALEKALLKKGCRVYYAFPYMAKETEWFNALQKRTKVFYLPFKANSRMYSKATRALKEIVKTNDISIMHSHFESYDIPCKQAAGRDIKVFWHLHDPIVKARRPQKNLIIKLQYAYFGRGVTLLSVCDYYRDIAIKLGFEKNNARTVINGIDLNRITYPYDNKNKEYDFLTFGWDFRRKGVDLILDVLKRLDAEGYHFSFLLNCNESSLPFINQYFNGELPKWVTIGKPVEDVNTLFSNSSTFIQASRRETFCYALCEAAYAGMDAISSDIRGLEWGHNVPSITFFESENKEQLYQLLKERLNQKTTVSDSVTEVSRKVIEENYSVDVWVNQIIREYKI